MATDVAGKLVKSFWRKMLRVRHKGQAFCLRTQD